MHLNFSFKRGSISLTLLLLMLTGFHAFSETNDQKDTPRPTLALGAEVYLQQCVLCHGKQGMGEGLLPIKLKDYPATNLMKAKYGNERSIVRDIVVYGGTRGTVSSFMPPMGNELSWTKVESVVDFVVLLRNDHKQALKLLELENGKSTIDKRLGQQIFSSRCVLCHGQYGEGNGRMAKVIKSPPPADLTASRLPEDYLKKIIGQGGQGVGRSPQMPPWGDQLNDSEISSVILYLESIRD